MAKKRRRKNPPVNNTQEMSPDENWNNHFFVFGSVFFESIITCIYTLIGHIKRGFNYKFSFRAMVFYVLISTIICTVSYNVYFKNVQVKYYPKPAHKIIEVKHIEYRTSYKLILNDDMILLTKYIKYKQPKMPIEIAERIAFEVVKQADANKIPWHVVVGIIQCESYYYPSAISYAEAKGLMQILRAHKIKIDPIRAYDIEYNIGKGIEILKQKLIKANGDLGLALRNYSGGHQEYEVNVIFKNMGELMLFKIKHNNITPIESINDDKKFQTKMTAPKSEK